MDAFLGQTVAFIHISCQPHGLFVIQNRVNDAAFCTVNYQADRIGPNINHTMQNKSLSLFIQMLQPALVHFYLSYLLSMEFPPETGKIHVNILEAQSRLPQHAETGPMFYLVEEKEGEEREGQPFALRLNSSAASNTVTDTLSTIPKLPDRPCMIAMPILLELMIC